jgi:hypothetical protein
MLTRVKFLNLQLGSWNRDHPIEKKKHGVQFLTNPMLKDKIGKKKSNLEKDLKQKSTIKWMRTKLEI